MRFSGICPATRTTEFQFVNEPSALDPAAIERLRKLGGDKFAAQMMDMFVSYGGKKVAEARLAQQAGNLKGVEDAAHPIKSSAGNIGAVRLQELAARIEQLAKESKAEAVTLLIDEFERAFAEAVTLIEIQKAGLNLKPA